MKTLKVEMAFEWAPVANGGPRQHVFDSDLCPEFFTANSGPAIYKWTCSDGKRICIGEAENLGLRVKRYQRKSGVQVELKRALKRGCARLEKLVVHRLLVGGKESSEALLSKKFGRLLVENLLLLDAESQSGTVILNKRLEDRGLSRRKKRAT